MVLHALGVMEHAFEAFGDAEAALVRALLERVGAVDAMKPQPVSYTHLTLPTILLV